jgi:hypothetical protein
MALVLGFGSPIDSIAHAGRDACLGPTRGRDQSGARSF